MRFEMYGHHFHTERFKYSSGKLGGYSVIHTASKAYVVEDFKTMREAVARAKGMMLEWGEDGTRHRIQDRQRARDAQDAAMREAASRV